MYRRGGGDQLRPSIGHPWHDGHGRGKEGSFGERSPFFPLQCTLSYKLFPVFCRESGCPQATVSGKIPVPNVVIGWQSFRRSGDYRACSCSFNSGIYGKGLR